jgi:hypothetical protein
MPTLRRQDGLTYGHGTGHGIGAYLNVHEGPCGVGGGSVSGDVVRSNARMLAHYLEPIGDEVGGNRGETTEREPFLRRELPACAALQYDLSFFICFTLCSNRPGPR